MLREVRFYPPEGRVLKTYGVDGLPNVNGTTGVIESIPAFLSNIDWANNGVLITITKSKGENLCIGVSPIGDSASDTNYTPEFHHCRNQAWVLKKGLHMKASSSLAIRGAQRLLRLADLQTP